MSGKDYRAMRAIPWVVRRAMPRLGFQRRSDGSFVYFPGLLSLSGSYEVPAEHLGAVARAAYRQRRTTRSLSAVAMAACILLGWAASRPLSIEIMIALDADRATIEEALRLGMLCFGLLAVAVIGRFRQQRFVHRHLREFRFAPTERRAVVFRPGPRVGAGGLRLTGLAGIVLAIALWGFHIRAFTEAYAEAGAWALLVEAQILLLLIPVVAYCIFIIRNAERVPGNKVAGADARERWAQIAVGSRLQKRGGEKGPKEAPSALVWRVLFPDFGSGPLARRVEAMWILVVWGVAISGLFLFWIFYERLVG